MSALKKELVYPHEPARVWAALTDPDAIAQWLMPNNFTPGKGNTFEFRVDPAPFYSGLVRCEVAEFDPPRRMVWLWTHIAAPGKRDRGPMRIEWTLTPEDNGRATRVTFTQHGLDALPWIMRKMMTFGWGTMLHRWLPKVLENFERAGDAFKYHRMPKPPNRGHHKSKTVPDTFSK